MFTSDPDPDPDSGYESYSKSDSSFSNGEPFSSIQLIEYSDRQTDRQTKRKCNTDKNMTSFAELKITVNEIAFQSKAGICTCMSLTLTP